LGGLWGAGWGAENATGSVLALCTLLQRRFGVAPGETLDRPGTGANEIGNE